MSSYLIIRGRDMGRTTPPVTDSFSGKDKFVDFHRGVGVLDLLAIHLERPDWVRNVAPVTQERKLEQVEGETLANYVRFWQRRGFIVEEITDDQAAEFRARIEQAREEERMARASFDADAVALFRQCYDAMLDQRQAAAL